MLATILLVIKPYCFKFMYGVDFICIRCGLVCGEHQSIRHLQKTKKLKVEQSSMLDVEWKATIKAKLLTNRRSTQVQT